MTLINKISTDVGRRASNEQKHNDNVNVAATICNSTAILAPYAINTKQRIDRPADRPSTLSWRRSTSRRLICRRRSLSVVCRRYWWYNGTLMGFSGFTYIHAVLICDSMVAWNGSCCSRCFIFEHSSSHLVALFIHVIRCCYNVCCCGCCYYCWFSFCRRHYRLGR